MANRYWVGGTGTWDSTATTHWSATSGGASGASAPTATDNAFFDDNSGSNYTVTITTGTCADFTAVKPTASDVTFAGGANFTTRGNFSVGAGVIWSSTGNLNFAAGTTGKTVQTNGVTFPGGFNFSTAGNGYQLLDDLTSSSVTSLLQCKGSVSSAASLDLNGFALTVGTVNFGGTALTVIAFGATGVINVTGNNATVWACAIANGNTFTGTPVVNFTYAGATGTRTIQNGSSIASATPEANAVTFNITAGTDIVSITGSTKNLNTTGFSGSVANITRTIYGNLVIDGATVITAGTAATTFAATSGTKTITTNGVTLDFPITFNGAGGTWQLLDNLTIGSTRTLTLSQGTINLNAKTLSTGLFVSSAATARSIAFGGGDIIVTGSATTVWSCAAVANFSYTGSGRVRFNYSGGTGTRTVAHGSTTGGSIATKAPPMAVEAGTDIFIILSASSLTDLDFTGFTGTLTNTARTLYGNLVLGTGMTATAGANAVTFANTTSTMTLTTNGVTTDFPVTIAASTGNFVLSEPLVLGNTRTLTVNSGNLLANSYDITTGLFVFSNGNNRTIDISNVDVTLTGTGTILNSTATTNLTLNATNSNILMSNNSSSFKFLQLGTGTTYGNIIIGGATSTAQTNIYGNATIDTLSSIRTVNQNIFFAAGDTFTVNNWNIVGTSTARVDISSDGVIPFNLIYGGNSNVNVNYHTISYSNASPANEWYALFTNNNNNGGTNTGWIFELPASSNFFLVF